MTPTQDHAAPFRRTLTGRATPADLAIVKRTRALATLGNRWVLHPEYRRAENAHRAPGNHRSRTLDCIATMARRAGRLE